MYVEKIFLIEKVLLQLMTKLSIVTVYKSSTQKLIVFLQNGNEYLSNKI